MKKFLIGLVGATILASTLSADFLRAEMGGGLWNKKPSGNLSYSDLGATGTYTSDEKEDSSAYAWLLVKHFVPIIPNLRLEYATLDDTGLATGSFNGFVAPADSKAAIKMTQYDIVPYYNILDNTFWMTVDVGLDIKMMNFDYSAENVTVVGITVPTNYEDSTSLVLPLGYLRARVQIPVTDIGVEADVKYITYGNSTVSEFRAKVDYTLDFVPVIQPGIEIGYRQQNIDVESDNEKTKLKMDYSGVYAGIMLRF